MTAELKYLMRVKDRWYFRRAGRLVRLPGVPGDADFAAAYEVALNALGQPAPAGSPQLTWLREHAQHVGDECLLWPFGGLTQGYGALKFGGKVERAHRAMCIVAHGEPPNDSQNYALHSCGNGHIGCVHPGHLRWGTQQENIADRGAHDRTVRGSRSPNARLGDSEVRAIRERIAAGETKAAVAADYDVSSTSIRTHRDRENMGARSRERSHQIATTGATIDPDAQVGDR